MIFFLIESFKVFPVFVNSAKFKVFAKLDFMKLHLEHIAKSHFLHLICLSGIFSENENKSQIEHQTGNEVLNSSDNFAFVLSEQI